MVDFFFVFVFNICLKGLSQAFIPSPRSLVWFPVASEIKQGCVCNFPFELTMGPHAMSIGDFPIESTMGPHALFVGDFPIKSMMGPHAMSVGELPIEWT